MLTKLLVKILRPLGVKALTRWVRDVAEGDHGEALQKVYWKLTGWKSGIGFTLALAGIVVTLTNADPQIGAWIARAGALLVMLGWTDKAWRSWRPKWLVENVAFEILAAHPVEVAGGFTAGYLWLLNDCTLGDPWCVLTRWVLVGLAAVAIQLGLLDAGWRAPAPQVSAARIRQITGRVDV